MIKIAYWVFFITSHDGGFAAVPGRHAEHHVCAQYGDSMIAEHKKLDYGGRYIRFVCAPVSHDNRQDSRQ